MIDLVYPKENEKEFISLASKLGFDSLCFIYSFSKLNKTKKIKSSNIKIYYGCEAKLNEAAKAKNRADLVIVKTTEPRRFLENKNIDLVYGQELAKEKDFIHFRRSGLNQVLCKLASQNNTLIGFSFSDLLNSTILGRIIQNIKLCRKYKIKTVIASFAKTPYEMRYWHDLISLFVCLGMDKKQAKQSFTNTEEKIKANLRKKSPKYISEGVEIV